VFLVRYLGQAGRAFGKDEARVMLC
jgi:hypothetical protein